MIKSNQILKTNLINNFKITKFAKNIILGIIIAITFGELNIISPPSGGIISRYIHEYHLRQHPFYTEKEFLKHFPSFREW